MMYTFVMSKKELSQAPFKKRNYYDISDTGIGYFLAIIAPYVVMVLVLIFMGIASSQSGMQPDQMQNTLAYEIVSCFIAPVGFCVLFFGFNKARKISFKAANLKPNIKVWDFVMCFVVAIICLFGMQYFIGGIDHLLVEGGYELSTVSLPMDNVGWLILAIVLMAVLPAVFEELIFRGIILNGLRSKMGDVAAIFLSAAMFAFMHGSVQQLIYQFALGVVIAWMVVRTGSLISGMIIHFLNNAMVLILGYIDLHYGGLTMSYNAWQWVICVVLVLVAAALLFVIEKFYFKHKNHEIAEKNQQNDEKTDENLSKEAKTQQDLKAKPYPILLWISIGVSVVLCLINTLNSFGAL